MKPRFFIVGAPKSGTTALSEYLRQHPAVFFSRPKEPFFFCEDLPGLPGVHSLEAYEALFSRTPASARLAGEGSAVYLFSRVALARIREYQPEARIIAMLRNPIELAPALHSQLLYNRTEDEPSFERAWALQAERRQGRSIPRLCREPALLQYGEVARLGEQVERLQSIFPKEQVELIFFDDFKSSPGAAYRRVLEFLDLPDDGRADFPKVNENKAHRNPWLARFTQHPPRFLSRIASTARRIVGREDLIFLAPLRRANASLEPRQPISERMREIMITDFAEDIERLARATGRDLSDWTSRRSPRHPGAPARSTDPAR